MHYSARCFSITGVVCTFLLCAAGCSPRRAASMTVADLMGDRVTLDGVLMKCNSTPSQASADADCLNARIATDLLAKDVDSAKEAKRTEDFERTRERLRTAQEKIRNDQHAIVTVDAYSLPLVSIEPQAPTSGPTTAKTGQPRR